MLNEILASKERCIAANTDIELARSVHSMAIRIYFSAGRHLVIHILGIRIVVVLNSVRESNTIQLLAGSVLR